MATRQKQLQRLERSLSIAHTKRAKIACRDGNERMAWSPPATFVEDLIPEEPIQLPPESMLFTVPENWQPPTIFPEDETRAITTAHHNTGTMDSRMEEFPICYVEEELSKECLQMAAQDDTILVGHDPFKVSEQEVDLRSTGMGAEERSVEVDHQGEAQEGTRAAASEAVGGGEVLAPPPITMTPAQWHFPPPFFHPYQLDLVLDLRL
jgi:hypothetical protein